MAEAVRRLKVDQATSEVGLWIDQDKITEEIGPAFGEISNLEEKLADLRDFEMRRLREMQSDPHAQKAHENLLKTIQSEKRDLENNLQTLEEKNPRAARAVELVQYRRGLHLEGHIASTPSVQANLQKIGTRMITGKPVFLHGPTGTGKTSLGRFAARHFTGQDAEMVYCNPQTREANIWGKTGIRPTENGGIQTVDIFGPLAKAMQEGKTVFFDEFTALPKEQMVFTKGIFNAKPGDMVNVVGNGRVKIAPGFQMGFSANLKSDKNPERQELPPEIAREFEQNNLEIDYTPKAEAYDIMLARLMNPDGSLDMSWHDLNVTLPKLCEALEEIQIAYTDKEREDTAKLTGTLDASGKRQGLKKFVMTQGTIEAILESRAVEKQRGEADSFVEFLDDRLKTGLTFKEYPEADRILAAKILASKGLLLTMTPEALSLPKNIFDFDASKKIRDNKSATASLLAESAKEVHISLRELADLDPFGVRRKESKGEQFLNIEYLPQAFGEGVGKILPGQLVKGPDGKVSVFVGISKADGSPVLHPYEQKDFPSLDLSQLEQLRNPFIQETFKKWNQNVPDTQISARLESPASKDYKSLAGDIDPAKTGEYTLNPEVQDLDFESAKVFIPDLSAFEGKPLSEVAEHLVSTFGNRYYLPGIEYWQWLLANPDKSPQSLTDGKYQFLFGSELRISFGHWSVPYAGWDGSAWRRYAFWLGYVWRSNFRVVLLER